MKFTKITANGDFLLTDNLNSSQTPEATVYMPASIGTAVVVIGYKDANNNTVPYTDGAILAGEQNRIRSGSGVKIVATVTNYSAEFDIGYAK